VEVQLAADRDGGVTVTVRDGGTWRPAPADPGFRGRGLQIVGALATTVDVDRGPAGTTLRFRLPPAAVLSVPAPRLSGGDPKPATLTVTEAGDRRCLELTGDLDLAGVDTVRTALLAELATGRPTTLDLTGLGYVTSVGAGLLLEAAQTAGDGMEVVLPAGGPARRLLDLAGLTSILRGEKQPRPR
jgi:anti-anti-sigma factor